MAEFLNITVQGTDSIDKDLDTAIQDMKRPGGPIDKGLREAATYFAPTLRQHLYDDWYEAWGEPKKYIRRTDNNGYGKSLFDYVEDAVVDANKLSIHFDYIPSGEHALYGNGANGDELINIIQYNRGWKWQPKVDSKQREIMPRPFWNNFIEEMKSGVIPMAFREGFISAGWKLDLEGGSKDMEWANGESLL